MSTVRGLGRRERVARNRHFRGTVYHCGGGSESGTYKLGRKKSRIHLTRSLMTSSSASPDGRKVADGARVAETETLEPASTGAPIVGPEQVSSPAHRKIFINLSCNECDYIAQHEDFSVTHTLLTIHRIDTH